MATDEAVRGRSNDPSWITAYLIYRKKTYWKTFTRVFEYSFFGLVVVSWLIFHLYGLSFGTFYHNKLLVPGWCIWIGGLLMVRYEVNKTRERFRYAKS